MCKDSPFFLPCISTVVKRSTFANDQGTYRGAIRTGVIQGIFYCRESYKRTIEGSLNRELSRSHVFGFFLRKFGWPGDGCRTVSGLLKIYNGRRPDCLHKGCIVHTCVVHTC